VSHKYLVSLVILVLISACAPSTSATDPLYGEKVDVGDYKLQILCSGEGAPSVIIDPAVDDAASESSYWLSVRHGIEKTTRICVYDRAGLGSSDAAPTGVRTSQDMVKDLHTLLVNANVPGPYILVGHNVGGFNVRLYASQYPEEVVGMVLMDSLHPDHESEILDVLPPELPGEPAILRGLRRGSIYPDPDLFIERIDLATSASQVGAADQLGDLPLVVLTSGHAPLDFPDLSPDVQADLEQVWQDLQVDLASLSSNSTYVFAAKPGSPIPVIEPESVIDAVLKVVDASKKPG
jgi:pimeloyl-ACP methyl ester carboxylesterase